MERQRKQREDTIFQVQRYEDKGLCHLCVCCQVISCSCSAIEKAKHIGKECSDALAQATSTVRSSELLLVEEPLVSKGPSSETKSFKQVKQG